MPDKPFKLYLDQMLQTGVLQALREEGHDVVRSAETGHARADDFQILQKATSESRILITLENISEIG